MTRRDDIAGATRRLLIAALAGLLLTAGGPHPAWAQDDDDAANEASASGDLDNRELFADFLHNAVLGKFNRADAYAKKLLANNPDPLEILQYADEHTNSLKTLILLVNNIEVSESAKQVLDLIHEGELTRRREPERIKEYINKLGGDPQSEFYAINRLRESGEYAIPWLVRALVDKSQSRLHSRIIRMLPRMGKEAVNPLVIALSMRDNDTKQFIVRALGEIGYPQALPYLLEVLLDPTAGPELKQQTEDAIQNIVSASPSISIGTASAAFLDLANQYYSDQGSVRADPRNAFANVWYWRDEELQRVEVPREIFDEIMAMRCCERALKIDSSTEPAIAIWLAANIRREAELGMNVESAEPDPAAALDPTKPEDFPRSTYFARSAGARYCHMVLGRALEYNEAAVALGAISALRLVAGATNLIGAEDYKQPLAQALSFPEQLVRIKAALALAHALPTTSFVDSDRVVPVLSEALAQTGAAHVLVVDPDEQNLNRIMGALRSDTIKVIGEQQLYAGLERARQELPSISAVFMATDVSDPPLAGAVNIMRQNNMFALTPIVLLTRKGTAEQANQIAANNPAIAAVVASAPIEQLQAAWMQLKGGVSSRGLEGNTALALALDAADALRQIAFSHSSVYDFSLAEGALIGALASGTEVLQIAAADVLALSTTSAAQQAIAHVALDSSNTESLRLAAFSSLAESAKISGDLLSDELTDMLIDVAMNEPNLTLRSAASQALGAANLPSNKAATIIERYDRG